MKKKLLKLTKYLKDNKLNYQYNLIKKISQMDQSFGEIEPEEEEEETFEEWMGSVPKNELILVSPDKISEVKDMAASCTKSFKPRGLWYANGTEWLQFLKYEMPDWMGNINHIYKIKPNYSSGGIGGTGGVLKLSTREDVLDFTREFGVDPYGMGTKDNINWPNVTKAWDGIEIIPYQDSLRMDGWTSWYYPWDIGSGCIWRPSGVSDMELLSSRPGK